MSDYKSLFNNNLLFRKFLLRLESLGLVNKLIFSYIMIIAIPITIFGFYTFNNIKTSTEIDAQKNNQQTLQQFTYNVNRNIDTCENASQTFINNKKFLEYLLRRDEISADELIEFKNGALMEVQNIQALNFDINRIRIFVKNSPFLEVWPTIYDERRIMDSEWINKVLILEGKFFWRLNHIDDIKYTNATYEDEVISLYREVEFPDNEYVGIIEVNMLTSTFFNEMYSSDVNNDSFICLISNKKSLFFNKKDIFFRRNSMDDKLLTQLLNEKTKGKAGDFDLKFNGKTLMAAYNYIPKMDTYIYKIISIEKITQKLNNARNYIILIVIGAITILSVFTFFITSVILNKIKIVKSLMRKVQDGDLDIDIKAMGNDEIGELAGHFRKMLQKIKELISVVINNQVAIKSAEIKTLQAQINSHFTYNTLETIEMMAEVKEQYDIADAVSLLGRLMRYSMSWDMPCISLSEEIEYVRNYIDLINIKYQNIIDLQVHTEERLLRNEIPKMSLQPIIENSVYHGIKPKHGRGVISLDVYVKDTTLVVEVTDNGKGIDYDKLCSIKKKIEINGSSYENAGEENIGLRNVNERIKLYYGTHFGLAITSEKDAFTKITIMLPFKNYSSEVLKNEEDFIG